MLKPKISLVFLSACFFFTTHLVSQNLHQTPQQVTEAIRAGNKEKALKILHSMLEQRASDPTLLRAQMYLLLGMRRNREAMIVAEALLKALPKGMEKEALRPFVDLVRKTKGELQTLIEKAILFRRERDPKNLLRVWKKLNKLRPEDPLVHFGMGVVYGSFGKEYNLQRSLRFFQKFLKLTVDDQFHVGSIYTPSELADSLRKFSTLGRESDLAEVRMMVHAYIKQLKEKRPLFLMTPKSTILRLQKKCEKELEQRNRVISRAEDDIQRCRDYLRTPPSRKHDLHTNKRKKIRQLELRISLEKRKVASLTLVLTRLKQTQ